MNERAIDTYGGLSFDFWEPDPVTIRIEDIAHALALTNRYGGHTRVPYSVAEHCVRCARLAVIDPLACLFHDSAEAYIGDILSPQKQHLQFNLDGVVLDFTGTELLILGAIGSALSIPNLPMRILTNEVHRADRIMLATEVRDLMSPGWRKRHGEWLDGTAPSEQHIVPWSWQLAEAEFLNTYEELTDGKS